MNTSTSNIDIRPVEREELKRIHELEKDMFHPDHYPLFVLRQFFDTFPKLFFVAVDKQNKIKGYCFGGINYDLKVGWIYALAVVKSEQKKKIGEQLTRYLLSEFEIKKIKLIQLTTTPDNTPAIKLYQKLGFKAVAKDQDYYLDNSPRLLMKKN